MPALRERASEETGISLQLALKLAAPYLAVGVFWSLLHNGWLAILAYHAQILWWARGSFSGFTRPRRSLYAFMLVPAALTAPVLYVVIPLVAKVDLTSWLSAYAISGAGLVAMVFYYGLVHPVLEQVHWAPLREATPFAHAAFAGYHMLVLVSLLDLPWLAVCFAVLASASWMWQRLTRESASLFPAVASHVAADLGMVVVAALMAAARV